MVLLFWIFFTSAATVLGALPNSSESGFAFPVAARWEVVVVKGEELKVELDEIADSARSENSAVKVDPAGKVVEPPSSEDAPSLAQRSEHRSEPESSSYR